MRPGDKAWATVIATAGIAELVLLRTERELLTDSARRHKILTVTLAALFVAHVFDVLGPADPFRLSGATTMRTTPRRLRS